MGMPCLLFSSMYHSEDKTGNLTEKNHRLKQDWKKDPCQNHSGGLALQGPLLVMVFRGPILFMLSLLKDIFKRCFLWHERTFSQHPSYISSRSLLLPDCFKEARKQGTQNSAGKGNHSGHFLWKGVWVQQEKMQWNMCALCVPKLSSKRDDCNTDQKPPAPVLFLITNMYFTWKITKIQILFSRR